MKSINDKIVVTGRMKLEILRKRMLAEKKNIIEYLEIKKLDENLTGVCYLWVDHQERKGSHRREDDWLPEGWNDWWRWIEIEAVNDHRKSRLSKSKRKQEEYKERTMPNLILVGWRTWWSRMESEASRRNRSWAETSTRSVKEFFKLKEDTTIPEGWRKTRE